MLLPNIAGLFFAQRLASIWAVHGRGRLDLVGADGGQIDDVPTSLAVPFVDLVFGQGGQRHDTGVVDHDVHPAVGVCGVGDEALDVSGVGDIQPAKRRGSAAVPLFDGENCYS